MLILYYCAIFFCIILHYYIFCKNPETSRLYGFLIIIIKIYSDKFCGILSELCLFFLLGSFIKNEHKFLILLQPHFAYIYIIN